MSKVSGVTGRIILVPFSPRVAPGLLSAAAWRAVTAPGARVHAGDAEHPILEYLDDQDVAIELIEGELPEVADELLKEAAAGETVVWLADPSGGDQPLVLALGERLTEGAPDAAEIELELLPGSYDVPGARLLDLVAVMDRLRSPGGCPWDAQQTHQSLVKYLLEEAYETVETIEEGDPYVPGEGRDALREELGDVLLQVAFHSRIAREHEEDPFDIDDVAQGIVTKLIRRHPHVFADVDARTASDVEANWEQIKAAEKGRTSAVEGVPLAQPALSLAEKLLKRAGNAGLDITVPQLPAELRTAVDNSDEKLETQVGALLLAVAGLAREHGVDPEAALRAEARGLREQILNLEASRSSGKCG
ncbi:MAG TPA: MazG family protein [Actinospica sp.]|nr:MazG family protein [Actinospica sp.]